ncbi:MAG: hypothetical protein IJ125_00390 [Atopobiaceae bacterium]|nr:hypothetical protein [Atopobiaceae bacterium]
MSQAHGKDRQQSPTQHLATRQESARQAFVNKLAAEFQQLTAEGVVSSGNVISSLMLIKGELSEAERAGAELLSGADGVALRAAFDRLGYAPENLVAVSALNAQGNPLPSDVLRRTVAAISPTTLVLCDEVAATAIRHAYAAELASEQTSEQMSSQIPQVTQTTEQTSQTLGAGQLIYLLGMRVLNLGGFEASLASEDTKQRSWRYLKKIPQLAEPY